MKKTLFSVLLTMVWFVQPAWAQTNTQPEKAAANSVGKVETHRQIQMADLYGFWGSVVKNEDNRLGNFSFIFPDGTARDLMVIDMPQLKNRLVIRQNVRWTFDEAKQEMQQTVTDFRTKHNDEKWEVQHDEIGKKDVAKVKMTYIDGQPQVLFIEKMNGQEDDTVVYLKLNEKEWAEALQESKE